MTAVDDIRLKLERAKHHLDALSAEIQEVVTEHTPSMRPRHNILDNSFTGILEDVPEVRRNWGVMLGDFLHNTRSALDHLVCDLVMLSGGTVHSRHQFPIYSSAQAWQQGVVNSPPTNSCLGFIDPSNIAFIESVQPYQATTGVKSLEVLRRFSNADKHRLIHGAVINTLKKPQLDGVCVIPLHLREVIYLSAGTPLKDGTEIARYQTQIPIMPSSSGIDFPGADYRINVKLGLTTVFGEPGSEDTRIKDFRKCLADVETIVDHFVPVL